MKIIASRQYPNGTEFFTAGYHNVKKFIVEPQNGEVLDIARALQREVVVWAANDIVRCAIWNADDGDQEPDYICYLDITGGLWWTVPVTTLDHHVTVVKSALRFYESESLACFKDGTDRENKRARKARDLLYEAEGHMHDFIVHTLTREAQDRAWAKSKEAV